MRNLVITFLAATSSTACIEDKPALGGTQSLNIEVTSQTGTAATRLSDTVQAATVNVRALDATGEVDPSFNNPVDVYVNYLGTLTPYLGNTPLAQIQMNAGVAMNQTIPLPPLYGAATLWFDDGSAPDPTYVAGSSATLWYRDPFIRDHQRPADEMGVAALEKSPLENKQIGVRASRHGLNGRLVVTSVFAQGYTVSDVLCAANGLPPCTTGDYDHAMVFSFSAPRDEIGRRVFEGQLIDGFAGGVSEFNGLTEISFPQTFVNSPDPESTINAGRIPAPAVFDMTWFTNKYMFERNEAGLISVANAKVCDLDKDWETYKQWKLDPTGTGGNCLGNRNIINVITTGIVPTSVIEGIKGKTVPRVIGVLRPVNIGSFNVWIIHPRSMADLTLP